MIDDELFLKELQEGFIEEAVDLVEQCEQYSLQLEKTDDVKSCIKILFRHFHTIKGTAASVEMKDLAGYTHKIENLLVAIKNEELKVNSSIIGLLLEASDKTKNYVYSKKQGTTFPLNVDEVEKRVNAIIRNENIIEESAAYKIHTDNHLIKENLDRPEEDLNLNQDKVKNLGDILLEENKITEDQLDRAIEEQQRKLGTILVESGYIEDDDLKGALSKQATIREKNGTPVMDEYIKLPLSKIDGLIDYLGEQVILQTALNYCNERGHLGDELMSKTIGQLNKITQDLQQSAISLRMFNLKPLFRKAQRLVRDTSVQLGKEIKFIGIGENAELDKTIVDELSGPITHLVRNSVDHGIEDKKTRIDLNKDPVGSIEIQAFQRSGFFYLVITDDGRGLDLDKIKQKAISLKMAPNVDKMSDEELYSLIFHSGFSTKEQATDVSGRGVGMDVVKNTIEKLRGTIQIKTKKNEGSSFIIKLPLTLAIFNGMVVDIGERKIVIPNSEVLSIIDKSKEHLYSIDQTNQILRDDDNVYPIIDLPQTIGIKTSENTKESKHSLYLIATNGQKKYAIRIKDILGQQKVVLKKLPENLSNLKGISGVTILGDGSVSLILDVNKTLSLYSNAS